MNLFRRNINKYETTLDTKFDKMMSWVKELDRKSYNKLKKAMDLNYDSHRILNDLDQTDDVIAQNFNDNIEFEEVK